MAAPVVSTLPAAPLPTDSRTQFNNKAYNFVGALVQFSTEINVLADWINAVSGGIAELGVIASTNSDTGDVTNAAVIASRGVRSRKSYTLAMGYGPATGTPSQNNITIELDGQIGQVKANTIFMGGTYLTVDSALNLQLASHGLMTSGVAAGNSLISSLFVQVEGSTNGVMGSPSAKIEGGLNTLFQSPNGRTIGDRNILISSPNSNITGARNTLLNAPSQLFSADDCFIYGSTAVAVSGAVSHVVSLDNPGLSVTNSSYVGAIQSPSTSFTNSTGSGVYNTQGSITINNSDYSLVSASVAVTMEDSDRSVVLASASVQLDNHDQTVVLASQNVIPRKSNSVVLGYGAFPPSEDNINIELDAETGRIDAKSLYLNGQEVTPGGGGASPGTTDDVPEGSTNQYFTQARVRSTPLTGFAAAAGFNAVLATDTILQAFNKVQGWLNGLGNLSTITGSSAVLTLLGSANTAALRTNIGATTVGSNFIATANPNAISFPRVNADNTVSYLDAAAFRTAIGAGSGAGLANFTEARNISEPNISVPVVSLAATGTELAVDLALVPKGHGALLAQIPDNTSFRGEKRGALAVDFQRSRNSANQVASGNYAAILGGTSNRASGVYAVVLGGASNTASGAYSVAGGYASQATGRASTVTGYYGKDRGVPSRVFSTEINPNYTSQIREMLLNGQTTNSTPTTLTTDGSGGSVYDNQVLNVGPYSAYAVEGTVVAKATGGGSSLCKSWKFTALITRPLAATTVELIGPASITATHVAAGTESWSVSVTADSVLGALAVTVVGAPSSAVRWNCYLKSIELTHS